MNYFELLNGYKCLPIKLEDSKFLLLPNKDIYSLNKDLFNLLSSYNFDKNQLLKYMSITPVGIEFDLTIVKSELFRYFGINEPDHAFDALTELEYSIKNKKVKILDLPKPMQQAFETYQLKRHINPKAKQKTINKARRNEFMLKARKDIRNFRYLLKNESVFSKVTNVFDENNLKLYLAYKVMLHALTCERNGDIKSAQFALVYLQRFIDNNPLLVKEGLSIKFSKRIGRKIFIQEYTIDAIVKFINARSPKKK